MNRAAAACLDGDATIACLSNLAPTRRIRWRAVSTDGMSSSGRNSVNSVARRAMRHPSPRRPVRARACTVGHDLSDRAERSRRPASLAMSPTTTMIRHLRLNKMDLQSRKRPLALRQCQSDRPRRVFARRGAAANLMNADGPIRPDQFQHDTPLHPALPVTPTGLSRSTPMFWTVSTPNEPA
jgi:hypothetical protein